MVFYDDQESVNNKIMKMQEYIHVRKGSKKKGGKCFMQDGRQACVRLNNDGKLIRRRWKRWMERWLQENLF